MNVHIGDDQHTPWQELLLVKLRALADEGAKKKFLFRSDLKDLLEKAERQGVSGSRCEEIGKRCQSVVKWVEKEKPDFKEAFEQWCSIFSIEKPSLDDDVLLAVLDIFPDYEGQEKSWEKFVSTCNRIAVVEYLNSSLFFDFSSLVTSLKKRPSALVAIPWTQLIPVGDAVWKSQSVLNAFCKKASVEKSQSELERMLSGIVNCLGAINESKAYEKFVLFLAEGSDSYARKALQLLFKRRAVCFGLINFISESIKSLKAGKVKAGCLFVRKILVVESLEVMQAHLGEASQTSSLVISKFLIDEAFSSTSTKVDLGDILGASSEGKLIKIATKALKSYSAENTEPPTDTDLFFPLYFSDLRKINKSCSQNKKKESSESLKGVSAIDSAHQSGREIILTQLAGLLGKGLDKESILEHLTVMLFNHGAVEFGEKGCKTEFVVSEHQGLEDGIFPGDIVEIISPGIHLVNGDCRKVLSKATVRLSCD